MTFLSQGAKLVMGNLSLLPTPRVCHFQSQLTACLSMYRVHMTRHADLTLKRYYYFFNEAQLYVDQAAIV